MTNHQNKTQPTSPQARLEQAIALAKSGQKTQAGKMLREIVAMQPVNQAAWLWLSAVSGKQAEAKAALSQAKKIDPAHHSLLRAEQWFVHRFSAASVTQKNQVTYSPSASSPPAKPSKNLFGVFNSLALGLAIFILFVGFLILIVSLIWEVNAAAQPDSEPQPISKVEPAITAADSDISATQLALALAEHNWAIAIPLLENAHHLQPNSQAIQNQLAEVYLQQGVTLRSQGFVGDAVIYFEKSLAIKPDLTAAQQEYYLASTYLTGVEHYQAGRWPEAISHLQRVRTEYKYYTNVKDLLYSVYYNQALAQQAAGELTQAKAAFESAITLRPDLSDPRHLLSQVEFALTTQTPIEIPQVRPSLEDRIIVVGIAEQRMLVYEGQEQIFDFVVSTGEPGRDTAIGDFEIQNKIDMAYASTWNLDMPYWMGIYWAGPLQNGIHSLPVVKHTGYKLWDGYLGQRVSYGCVILGDEDAATLYHWAEEGTKVKIVPSLDSWSPEG